VRPGRMCGPHVVDLYALGRVLWWSSDTRNATSIANSGGVRRLVPLCDASILDSSGLHKYGTQQVPLARLGLWIPF
jgi:hypothetical protein